MRQCLIRLMISLVFLSITACASMSPANEPSSRMIPTKGTDTLSAEYHKAALVNVELGLGYLAQGQMARAKSKLVHAVRLAPTLSEVHSAMAYFLEQVNDNAEQSHKRAIQLASHKGAVYNNYGTFLCRQGRFKEADHAFSLSLKDKEYPYTAEIYENAGSCAAENADQAQAMVYFTKAIQHDPKRVQLLLELAYLHLKQEQAVEARELLNRYQQNAAPTARSTWLSLQIAQVLNDKKTVVREAETLKKLFKDSTEYRQYLNRPLDQA
jgi:type IV pilus assembly protein PilF